MSQLQYIQTSKIKGHPNNPRKDLGDLTELADSVRAQGILQNLTVVQQEPGYCTPCDLYDGGVGKCSEGHDENNRPPCSKWEGEGKYTVIIGHRRLAASKLAGLEEVPCVIVEMTQSEQVATMLLENMQRNDLTLWEQAQGFQMMLDLGETLNGISEKTGLSESTVRRRMKLLDLDGDKFKASIERGATLQDYVELDKIEDPDLRNQVLNKIGTDNFRYELNRAISREKEARKIAVLIEKISEFATRVDCGEDYAAAGYRYSDSYHSAVSPDDITRPDDADTVQYFFAVSSYGTVRILTKRTESEASVDADKERRDAAARAMKERQARLDEITAQAYDLRYYFVKTCSVPKKHLKTIIEFIARSKAANAYDDFDEETFCGMLGVKFDDDEGFEYEHIAERLEAAPEKMLFLLAYCSVEDAPSERYYSSWNLKPVKNGRLDNIYRLLEALGYRISDEERALKDGTHELLEREVEEKPTTSEPEEVCVMCKSTHPGCDNCCSECEDRCNAGQVCSK